VDHVAEIAETDPSVAWVSEKSAWCLQPTPGSADKEDVEEAAPFEEVLAAAQAAAPWACTAIWTKWSPRVAGYLRSRGSADPEDLTSEVFSTVFSKLPSFVGDERAFKAFVFTVAHRRLVDELRTRARRGLHVEWRSDEDPRQSSSAEHDALRSLGDTDARTLLDGLSRDQREVLVLRIFADLTIEQIAELLGKRPGAVKALQRRGLEALRKKLQVRRTPTAVRNDGAK
jgi:RNA polymerase sigma factor (sigma-70 family)